MRTYLDSRIVKIAFFLFFLTALSYAFYEIRGQLIGPTISLESIPSFSEDSFIRIKGSASRISSLTMNGGEIAVTESGAFDEPYALAPGSNRIVLEAKDAYGHTKQSIIDVVYRGSVSTNELTNAPNTRSKSTDTSSTANDMLTTSVDGQTAISSSTNPDAIASSSGTMTPSE